MYTEDGTEVCRRRSAAVGNGDDARLADAPGTCRHGDLGCVMYVATAPTWGPAEDRAHAAHAARWDCARHERGREVTPTWARAGPSYAATRAGPRYVATPPTWGPAEDRAHAAHAARWDCARHERGGAVTPTWARSGRGTSLQPERGGPTGATPTAITAISAITAGAPPAGRSVACCAGLFATRTTKVVQNA